MKIYYNSKIAKLFTFIDGYKTRCKVVYNHLNNNYLTGDYHKAMAQGFVIPVASVV